MSTWLPIWPNKRAQMNELALANRAADWRRLKALVLDSVSSPITKRVYNLGLDGFFAWYGQEPRPAFTKATVSAWRVALGKRPGDLSMAGLQRQQPDQSHDAGCGRVHPALPASHPTPGSRQNPPLRLPLQSPPRGRAHPLPQAAAPASGPHRSHPVGEAATIRRQV
jgi:hypothetical protein